MLERYNPVLRLVCLALAGVILYQISRLVLQRDAVARSRIEAPIVRISTTNKSNVETNAVATKTNAVSTTTNSLGAQAKLPPGMNRRPGGPAQLDLPADPQAMIDKIKQSQLLGPDIKPPPM